MIENPSTGEMDSPFLQKFEREIKRSNFSASKQNMLVSNAFGSKEPSLERLPQSQENSAGKLIMRATRPLDNHSSNNPFSVTSESHLLLTKFSKRYKESDGNVNGIQLSKGMAQDPRGYLTKVKEILTARKTRQK